MADQTMLTISYALSLSYGTNTPSSLTPNNEHAFSIENGRAASSNNREYYEALRKAIAAAKDKVGEELTTWRDALGNAELGKEKVAKASRAEDEDEDEDEDDEE